MLSFSCRQNRQRVGGWEFAIIEPNYGTRLRPRFADPPWKASRPRAGSLCPTQQPRNPRNPPGATAEGWMVFHAKLQQPGRRNPSVQEAPRIVGKDNHKLHIRKNPRRSGFPREKSPMGFYAGKPDPTNPKRRTAQTRRPSTSEPPYSLGRNEPGCDGTTAAKQPPPRHRKFTM